MLADNSRQVLSVEDTGIPPKTFKQETMKPSQISRQDMKLTANSQAFMAARDRKIYPGAASSEGRCKDPIDGPSHPSIQRKNMSSDQNKIKVSLLDEINSEDFPKFNYIPCNTMYQSANVNISLARIADEDC